jgi:hypothetical protein
LQTSFSIRQESLPIIGTGRATILSAAAPPLGRPRAGLGLG